MDSDQLRGKFDRIILALECIQQDGDSTDAFTTELGQLLTEYFIRLIFSRTVEIQKQRRFNRTKPLQEKKT